MPVTFSQTMGLVLIFYRYGQEVKVEQTKLKTSKVKKLINFTNIKVGKHKKKKKCKPMTIEYKLSIKNYHCLTGLDVKHLVC
jgi:hypothetical protein